MGNQHSIAGIHGSHSAQLKKKVNFEMVTTMYGEKYPNL